MARKHESHGRATGHLRGLAGAVKRFFTRGADVADDTNDSAQPSAGPDARQAASATGSTRRPKVSNDIPQELRNGAYTPPLTSSKASFRSDGSDHQTDQEFTLGAVDERFNDEDRLTNKSGDPRIGTHGRTYEPTEAAGRTRK